MKKFKKFMAVALAATMVVGGSITAFADNLSGGTDGTGTSEGHVDKEVVNVVLPTVAEGTTPFAYTMDPERLIQETDAAKYAEGTVFPDADGDTGVYFLTADKTYSNTSNTLQAINKSSTAITLTVKVKATQGSAKDIALATSSTVATTDTPDLYLGLKVGDTTTTVKTEQQEITKTIAGVPSNFEVAVKDVEGTKSYVYQEKASASTWKAVNISMTGAVSELAIASDTTAPTVNVTWSYEKAAEGVTADTDVVDYSTDTDPTISSVTEFDKADAEDVVIAFTLGTGSKAVEADGAKLLQGSSNTAVNTAKYEVNMSAKTITIDKTAGFMTSATADIPITVVLTKNGEDVKTITGTIKIK